VRDRQAILGVDITSKGQSSRSGRIVGNRKLTRNRGHATFSFFRGE